MAIELIDTIKPKNGGSFPMVEAKYVAMPDGTRLSEFNPGSGLPEVTEADNGKVLGVTNGTWGPLDPDRVTVLPEMEVTCDVGFDASTYYTELKFGTDIDAFTLVPGETYIVAWNGEEYELVAETVPDTTQVVLGNGSIVGMDDHGVQFAVCWLGDYIMVGVYNDVNGPHTIAIYQDAVNNGLPAVTAADNGKFLRVVDGKLALVALTDVSEVGM